MVLVLATAATAATSHAPPSSDVAAVVERATTALERGRWADAQRVLAPVVTTRALANLAPGQRRRVLELWAQTQHARGDPEAASESLQRARREAPAPEAERMALALAELALEMADEPEAERWLDGLGGAASDQASVRLLRALILTAREDTAGASTILEDLVDGPDPPAEACHELGVIRYEAGAREEAVRLFRAALRSRPDGYYASIYLARALLDLGRHDEASHHLADLRSRVPSPEVFQLSGRAALRAGRPEEAVRYYRRALELSPTLAEALYGLGSALRRTGDREGARRILERHREIESQRVELRRQRQRLHQRALREPGDGETEAELARVALLLGNFDAAQRRGWRALRAAPADPDRRVLLARALARGGRLQAASAQYQWALRLDPQHDAAREELAELVRQHARTTR